ncbi:MAG: DoxX family protein [Zhengella sp.]|uniref:DoxX family protein n=1 Tax=Zhengella sp. TaxID=2282762 RepID=UPI001D4BC5EF|nr:DoxX family protein [Notoacmeibacter sp.]MCC0026502.1 DoxX family protein [Brucellaceae bacterium]
MNTNLLLLAGRVLAAFIFIMAGWGKLAGGIDGTAGYIASVGLPASTALAWLAAIFELVAGLFILAGLMTRATALALAAFCVFTGFVFHFDPADQMQFISFMKNLAIAGGFAFLAVSGPGAWSVDARLGGGKLATA